MLKNHQAALARYQKEAKLIQLRYEAALAQHRVDAEVYRLAVEKAKEEGSGPPAKPRPAPRPPANPNDNPHGPANLYHGMIHPLLPFAIKGAIWYQGESNAGRAYQYRTLFPAMIQSWRAAWNQGDFPFLFVQLAPYDRGVSPGVWPELREAQLLTTKKLPHTAMAVITDVGDRDDIHPRQKEPVGARLALLARKHVYGEDVVASGPTFDSVKFENGKAVVKFANLGGGLVAKGGPLTGFTVCGPDKQFHKAQAEIQHDTVVVWSDEVKEPVAVRFGWENFPVVNLWNKEGLPASPFRTDDFPGVTWPKEKRDQGK
jgi:sialate O-acetylesterase